MDSVLEELQSSIDSHGTTLTIELFRPLPTAINCLSEFRRYLVEKIKCTKDSTLFTGRGKLAVAQARERESEFGFDLDQIAAPSLPLLM